MPLLTSDVPPHPADDIRHPAGRWGADVDRGIHGHGLRKPFLARRPDGHVVRLPPHAQLKPGWVRLTDPTVRVVDMTTAARDGEPPLVDVSQTEADAMVESAAPARTIEPQTVERFRTMIGEAQHEGT